ncbi:retrotransposon protein, putative, ty1-copia subclass [Tanacetum coccineum]
MFEREKLSGSNFNDWFRLLKLVLRVEKKLYVIEQLIPPAPAAGSTENGTQFMMLIMELKSMFEKQVGVERFDLIQTFHACKQEDGKSVSSYVLKMKGYVEQLKRLGYVLPQDISVGLILNGLTSDFVGFVRNYNMHTMGKTIGELHALLIEYEKGLPKKAATPQVLAIQGGRIQKSNKKSQNAKGNGKGKGKGKDKLVYAPKPKNPKPSAKEHPTKDDACHHYKEVGHWKRNCHVYLAELMKKKKHTGSTSTSGILTIKLFSFPNKSWVYDTGCGTHICNTKQDLRGERNLKQGAVYLCVSNGVRAQVEAIGIFDLVLPNGLVICLDNCHYAPTITRGVVLVSRFVDNGFIQRFTDYGISLSKNDVLYFNVISRDGIHEIDMLNLVLNVNYIYNVSNKRAKLNLDSTYMWHCRLAHISKKRIEKLQHDGLLIPTDSESFDQCVSCLSGKMTRKPFSHRTKRYYALEFATRILNMVQTKKVDKTPYELRYEKVLNLSYLKVWGCETLVKRDTPDKHGRAVKLEEIQDEYTSPSENTSEIVAEVEGFEPPQEDETPIRRSVRTHRAPERLCLNVKVEEHSLGDLSEPANSRLVAKGYTQTYSIDYEETFSHVADIRAIRILIAIAAFYDYEIWQMDVKTAFLNGYLDEDIYMVQPEGFIDLKHPRKASESNVTFLILYVDDLIIMGNRIPMLQSVKTYLGKCFAMKDLGEAAFILGIKIYRDRSKRLVGLSHRRIFA